MRFSALTILFTVMFGCSLFAQAGGPDAWKANVFGADWASETARLQALVPSLSNGEGLKATDADTQAARQLSGDVKARLEAAVRAYYQRLETVTPGYAQRSFVIEAVREVGNYRLLWISEPQIDDGGRSLVYSTEKDAIVGDFWDGGIRG